MEEMNTISPVRHLQSSDDQQSSTDPSSPVKRRKISFSTTMSEKEKEAWLVELNKEYEGLFNYYREVMLQKEPLTEKDTDPLLIRSVIACLLEERAVPYSKLVVEIHDKLKDREGVNLGYVSNLVLELGHRKRYGIIMDADADVNILEDEKEHSLCCWETRNLKLIPEIHHADLKTRRFCRTKIQERIKAVAGMIEAIRSNVDINTECFMRSSKESDIRMSVEYRAGRYKKEMEINIKVNEVKKEFESKAREAEKERKQDEKVILQQEMELKRFLEKSEREAKRLQKEAGQMEKKIKKLQEEAEKKRRKWEKELADVSSRVSFVREQVALEKKLSMMQRSAKGRRGGSSTTTGPASPVDYGTPTSSEPEDTTPHPSSASSLEKYAST